MKRRRPVLAAGDLGRQGLIYNARWNDLNVRNLMTVGTGVPVTTPVATCRDATP